MSCAAVAGTMMGNVVSMPVAGLLCQYGFSEGWDSVFYVIGERAFIGQTSVVD